MTSILVGGSQPLPVVGWIGLGSMGGAMAKNIQQYQNTHGLQPLRVFNRTASRCKAVEELGGKHCDTIEQLSRECNIVFISSSDDDAVKSIIEQIIMSGDVRGKVIVDTTTVHPDTSKAVSDTLQKTGALFAALPVFGASPVAQAGQLLAAFAGPDGAYTTVSHLLRGVIAREVLMVGQEPEKALLLKTTGNLLMASLMQIVAEAHVFASKTGLDSSVLERLLQLNFGTVAHSDSMRMTTGVYCPGKDQGPWSDLDLAIKDVGHGVSIAERAGVELKAANTAFKNLHKAKHWATANTASNPDRKLDSSSLYGVVRMDSGLDFETDFVKERDRTA